jgi:alkylation response protein AidB-like acyl-CoA dehydrogenase
VRYLPRILSGEDYWCQGFSEPEAGSDLASLRMRAIRVGDRYVVNGSKLWTTHAQFADHIFCLVRTAADGKPQVGISFLLIDLRQPGVDVRPIIGLAGDHEVNAVFFEDVAAPVSDLVGQEGQGWAIAKFLLENERGGSCHAPRLLAHIQRVRRTASENGVLEQNRLMAATLARLEVEAMALETCELRILAEIAEGRRPGPQTSLIKLVASSLRQKIDAAELRIHGFDGLQLDRRRPLYGDNAPAPIGGRDAQVASARYLNSRAWTIFGGTNEVQRSIIARSVLGL